MARRIDKPATLQRAREQIAELERAATEAALWQAHDRARGWLGALLIEDLVSIAAYEQLMTALELAHARRDPVIRAAGGTVPTPCA
ncbi:hypothetical protein AB9U01_25160 [Pseudomonas qingdaonensis]|uniref:hypothetical protein n=1 Tax=Pseudomonas qingdaonensis TaxID=2056231 RepID=UPI003513546A